MSKLTIFLCVVLVASAVNASYVSDSLVAAEKRVEGLIETTVKATREKFDDIKSKAEERIASLKVAAKSAGDKLSEHIKSSLDKAQAEITKLTGKETDVDCTDCNKLAAELEKTGRAVVANMSECIDEKLATGNGYVENIIKLSENVLANLTAIREEARHCGDNVDGVKAAALAIVCTNAAAVKAAWVETKAVPSLAIEMTKITYTLATLQPSLTYCTVSNGIVAFYHESSIIAEKTKQCIAQKKEEFRPSTEKVSTEKPKDAST